MHILLLSTHKLSDSPPVHSPLTHFGCSRMIRHVSALHSSVPQRWVLETGRATVNQRDAPWARPHKPALIDAIQ